MENVGGKRKIEHFLSSENTVVGMRMEVTIIYVITSLLEPYIRTFINVYLLKLMAH